ncbi:hypothetical protein H1C71_011908 [Ictidomys tridecemlineatus]|nr:hypothetical protein H1C71_011908 [Ictidomys tridecemlineatus]
MQGLSHRGTSTPDGQGAALSRWLPRKQLLWPTCVLRWALAPSDRGGAGETAEVWGVSPRATMATGPVGSLLERPRRRFPGQGCHTWASVLFSFPVVPVGGWVKATCPEASRGCTIPGSESLKPSMTRPRAGLCPSLPGLGKVALGGGGLCRAEGGRETGPGRLSGPQGGCAPQLSASPWVKLWTHGAWPPKGGHLAGTARWEGLSHGMGASPPGWEGRPGPGGSAPCVLQCPGGHQWQNRDQGQQRPCCLHTCPTGPHLCSRVGDSLLGGRQA